MNKRGAGGANIYFYFISEGWRGENKIVILLPKVGAYKTGNKKGIPIRGQFHKIYSLREGVMRVNMKIPN